MTNSMTAHEFDFRVAYADTDRMGVVYYANYLMLFERGRTELFRELGFRYRDLEDRFHVFLPAMQAHLDYLSPARYDDLIRVRTEVAEVGGASLTFTYQITNVENGKLLVRGSTKHPFVNQQWKPVRTPHDLRKALAAGRG